MKRLFVFLLMASFILIGTSPLFAGGVDNKHNFSAEYIRTLNRNAATDSADAVVYNPAGVVQMDNGLYANLSLQYAFKDYSHNIAGTEFESDIPSIVPGIFCLYRQDKWAGFAALTIPCGGGGVEYDNGSATTATLGQGFMAGANQVLTGMGVPAAFLYNNISSQKLESDSFYFGYTLGGAYKLNESVSLSLGARYIDAYRERKGSVTISPPSNPLGITDRSASIDYEETADGWGAILGLGIAICEQWDIGLRYETKTDLDFTTDVNQDDLGILIDGSKARRDLPALLGLGVSCDVQSNMRLETNLTYYFQEDADWNGAEKNVDNGYDLGIALEYSFSPELKGSVGYLYTETGIDADYMTPEAPELDAQSIAAGVAYEAIPGLDLNFGLTKTFYKSEKTSSGMELEKDVTILAFGIQYKFM